MTKETGGPAFPSSTYDTEYERYFQEGGMTLRDYFAVKAMREVTWLHKTLSAEECYEIADAMLEARK